ncbi:MAG: hypothetical protein LBI44_00960 [Oscillospiraceae bacterium]|jgi:hypothetical protein|nr:hypothetical protein [Oscillospiraceae bacterium]
MRGKISDVITVACFLSVSYVLFFMNIIKPSDELSFSERRRLAQFPELSAGTIFSAEFMRGFDDYAADQMVYRNEWRRLKAAFDLGVFRKHDNNAIFVSGGMVFKTEYPLRESSVRRLCGIINYCDERFLSGQNVYYTLVPDKNYYLGDGDRLVMDYEALADLTREHLRDNIRYIDLFGALSLDCYYLTDSHWKQEKLGGVTAALSEGLGVDIPFDASDYAAKRYYPFYGVYYGQAALNVEPDEIIYLVNDVTENATVTSLEKPGKLFAVYDEAALEGMDSYNLFMLGPAAAVTVKNPAGENGRGLVIFRDSYASSLTPLLLEGYDTVTLIDLRYIRPDLLANAEIVGEYADFTDKDILFMFSATVFNNSDSVKSAQNEDFASPFAARSRID